MLHLVKVKDSAITLEKWNRAGKMKIKVQGFYYAILCLNEFQFIDLNIPFSLDQPYHPTVVRLERLLEFGGHERRTHRQNDQRGCDLVLNR